MIRLAIRDSKDETLDRIINRASTGHRALYDTLLEELTKQANRMKRAKVSNRRLAIDLEATIHKYREPLAELMADSDLVGWVVGSGKVASKLPFTKDSIGQTLDLGESLSPWEDLVHPAVISLQKTGVVLPESWQQQIEETKTRSKATAEERIAQATTKVREAVMESVEEGTTYRTFLQKIEDALGESAVSPNSVDMFYRDTMARAYHDGQEMVAENPVVAERFPYRRRVPIKDVRLTELCETLAKSGINGTGIYLADDPVWLETRPQSHHRCRCGIVLLSEQDAVRYGVLNGSYVDYPQFPPGVSMPDGWYGGKPQ